MKKIYLFFLFFSSVQYLYAQWSALGGFAANSTILAICSDPYGNIYAAGEFLGVSNKRYVAKWNGSNWSELGGVNGLNADLEVEALCSDGAGNIYAAGNFRNTSMNHYVAKWNGIAWSEVGGLNGLAANSDIRSICMDASGNLYAAGGFLNSQGHNFVSKWNGSSWSELGGFNSLQANAAINAICADPAGNIYAAGAFTNGFNSSNGHKYVALWNGTAWSELGGIDSLAANHIIKTICSDASGNIYAVVYLRIVLLRVAEISILPSGMAQIGMNWVD